MQTNLSLNKQKALLNTKKAYTSLGRIINTLEENKYCVDIMQQDLAVIGLLKSANNLLLEGHLKSCFKNAILSKDEKKQEEKIQEIIKVTKLSQK
ncbi:MAG: transcriptional regulator [Candidatus Magasanikbacteria bacterium CG_4_10_14_0_8_um_filter_32_14]|uniref:Copper-sensing transcriptional repressor CsoR n=1 Tax=Candidatus Magasanikbacteria bacterium CG_4_10_14_0_8_um_filter_32_14 TaxID=1974640 RepID=A0A2M7R8M8_9BACT|nr:MAG: transcriptional regulator [Candidatus Magasanikbacteria bacterium CG_4_10_14_0_8_um_filter_32_14]